jgi:hypothetical protein
LLTESEKERILGLHKKAINESRLNEQGTDGTYTFLDWSIRPDGSFVLSSNVPKNDKCYAVPAIQIFYKSSKTEKNPIEYWKTLETSLKSQFGLGANYQTLRNHFLNIGCPFSNRKVPKTEDDLSKGGYYLTKGDRGELVKKLQKLLANSAEGYAEQFKSETKPGKTPFDGIFGQTTYSVVREFQKDNSLPQDGKVGKLTWDKLKNTRIKFDWDINTKEYQAINTGEQIDTVARKELTQVPTSSTPKEVVPLTPPTPSQSVAQVGS